MTSPTQYGRSHIESTFESLNQSKRAAFMPYFTLGYPDRETSLAVIEAIAPYSDLLELGVPFSDPIADGPTVQRSTQKALESGATSAGCLEMLRELRHRGVQTPVLLMGYYNPILAYGEARYVHDAAEAGADGFIVPDLSAEEAEPFESLATEAGMAFVHFLAPTSSPERIAKITGRAKGFIYLVSLTGITGARSQLTDGLADYIGRVRSQTETPLAVGFGISTPQHAADVGRIADGVIVGSALINAVDAADDKPAAAASYVREMAAALK
ncbi:MAG: tryptophan synthase subunit alpha [Candidatus Promineifilaceae bacterium]